MADKATLKTLRFTPESSDVDYHYGRRAADDADDDPDNPFPDEAHAVTIRITGDFDGTWPNGRRRATLTILSANSSLHDEAADTPPGLGDGILGTIDQFKGSAIQGKLLLPAGQFRALLRELASKSPMVIEFYCESWRDRSWKISHDFEESWAVNGYSMRSHHKLNERD